MSAPCKATAPELIQLALRDLSSARDLLKRAGAVRATDKVRSAMKSAEGAHRHAVGMQYRRGR